ncbi:Late control gene D protein; GpD [Erwinia sp. Ejp617]|nr:Late control gene D protein; GpD [Erwinia sp. Ejp617]
MEWADGNVYVLRKTYQNEAAAKRAAAAKWQQLQRGAAAFSITLTRGRAELYPDCTLPSVDLRMKLTVRTG